MESKTKHRLIAAAIVAGLVVILLPFFQHHKTLNQEVEIAKAPPFPDKNIDVASAEIPDHLASRETETSTNELPETLATTVAEPINPQQVNQVTDVAKKETIVSNSPVDINEETDLLKNSIETIMSPSQKPQNQAPIQHIVTNGPPNSIAHPSKPSKHLAQKKINNPNTTHTISNNGLYDFNHPTWVIQLGSFNEKGNALRLVNRLRAKGYQAFMQDVKTTVGQSTRVFVGPEKKQSSAKMLAEKIENHLKIHGVILSYKPLAL